MLRQVCAEAFRGLEDEALRMREEHVQALMELEEECEALKERALTAETAVDALQVNPKP